MDYYSSLALLALFYIQSSALIPQNGTGPFLRTFSGHFVLVTVEPIDYMYALEDDVGDHWGSGGSGGPDATETGGEPAKRDQQQHHHHGHHGRHHPAPKRLLVISEQAKRFLQGGLATILVPAVYTLVFCVSVPLNLLAAVMFVRRIRPRKPAVVYMLNLALADLLFAALLPFKIAYHFHGNDWIYGAAMCRVVTAAFYGNMYCSVLLMSCIAADRLLAVVYPMDSLTWRSPRTAAAVCAAAWLVSLGAAAPLLLSEQTARLHDPDITTCHDVQDIDTLRSYYLYFFPIYSSVFFFVPLAATTVCYGRIVRALAAADVVQRSKKRRALVMAVTVLVVFVACFTPTNVILMVHYARLAHGGAGDSSYQAYLLSMCAGSVSCCLDPLIYYFGSSQCQRQVVALLRCQAPGPRGRGLSSSSSSSRTGSTRTSCRTDSTSRSSSKMESLVTGSHYRKLFLLKE